MIRYIIAALTAFMGIGAVAMSVRLLQRLNDLARSATPNLADYPDVMFIASGLLEPAPGSTVKPAELASQVQTRILGIGFIGIVLLFVAVLFLFATRRRQGTQQTGTP